MHNTHCQTTEKGPLSATPSADLLWTEYLPLQQLAQQSDAWNGRVLGAVCFAPVGVDTGQVMIPLLTVPSPVLGGDGDTLCEVWHSGEPLTAGVYGTIRYRHSENLLFGCISLPEQVTEPAVPPLQSTADSAYRAIFELLTRLGYDTVLRFWNYFPAINEQTHGIERYRQFNAGRQNAFLAHGYRVIGNVPAACALGSDAGGLNIAFLAVRREVIAIENPRQVSAYHYPSEYGPRSPTFSRACLMTLNGRPILFVSGTASIVGHQTQHRGSVVAQTRESMINIDSVVREARRHNPEANLALSELYYKVYVRQSEHLAQVRREIEQYVGGPVHALYLRADICRADLLVEIEATGGHRTEIR